jgi:hypothetical protein
MKAEKMKKRLIKGFPTSQRFIFYLLLMNWYIGFTSQCRTTFSDAYEEHCGKTPEGLHQGIFIGKVTSRE